MITIFKTSVSSHQQVHQVKHHLNKLTSCAQWTIDLEDCDKVLRIDSQEDVSIQVIAILKALGFECVQLHP